MKYEYVILLPKFLMSNIYFQFWFLTHTGLIYFNISFAWIDLEFQEKDNLTSKCGRTLLYTYHYILSLNDSISFLFSSFLFVFPIQIDYTKSCTSMKVLLNYFHYIIPNGEHTREKNKAIYQYLIQIFQIKNKAQQPKKKRKA